MKNKDHLDIPLECYHNGSFDIMTFQEVLKIIATINFLWLCVKDKYYWHVESFIGESHVCKPAGKKGLMLSFLIHTNNGPYTLYQAQKDLNNGKEIDDPNLFVTWAARFNCIFKKKKQEVLPRRFWPFYHLVVPSGYKGITVPAYTLNPDYETLVLVDVDRDSSYSNSDVPWELLSSNFTLKRNA